jgi:cytosine/adenosine deaminase-related metal-dependent hydrolase
MSTSAQSVTAIDASYVLVPRDGHQHVVRDRTVVIQGDRITDVVERYDGEAHRRIDARGKLLSPGFINSHVHAGTATYVRGLAEDRDLLEGTAFYHYAVPLLTVGYGSFTPDEFAAVLEWDLLELVKKGSTTVLEESFGGAEVVVELVERLGNRAYVSATYPGQVANIGYIKDGKLVYDRPALEAVQEGFRRGVEFHERHHGGADDRVRVRLSPTGPDTCPPELLRATREEADRLGCGISIHAAHHATEIRFCLDNFGRSPIGHLADTGVLGPDAVVTHVTFTDEDDRRLLAETASTVVHCPVRKAREAVITPFQEYVDMGINVALGTDSYSSDFVETIRATAMLGKIRQGRVGAATAQDVIDAATLGAARGLGRDDLGRIEPGAKADLVLIDLERPHNFPVIDPLVNFVHYSAGTDVTTVIVDGRVIVEDGVAVNTDEDALRERVRAATSRIYELGAGVGALPRPQAAATGP